MKKLVLRLKSDPITVDHDLVPEVGVLLEVDIEMATEETKDVALEIEIEEMIGAVVTTTTGDKLR